MAPGLELEGMAFVPRFITVEGLHGGNCNRPDPSPQPHQLERLRTPPYLGDYKLYTLRVNVKLLT